MAVKTVTFVEDFRYDGNTKIHKGMKLLEEFYDTKAYKSLNPGDIYSYTDYRGKVDLEMVSAEPFKATLRVLTNGDKTVTLIDDENKIKYPMFHSDFVYMAMKTTIERGVVTGVFGFVKKNIRFGIEFLSEVAE